jgi:hypothetical protein
MSCTKEGSVVMIDVFFWVLSGGEVSIEGEVFKERQDVRGGGWADRQRRKGVPGTERKEQEEQGNLRRAERRRARGPYTYARACHGNHAAFASAPSGSAHLPSADGCAARRAHHANSQGDALFSSTPGSTGLCEDATAHTLPLGSTAVQDNAGNLQ